MAFVQLYDDVDGAGPSKEMNDRSPSNHGSNGEVYLGIGVGSSFLVGGGGVHGSGVHCGGVHGK